jgi:hypothetical protein
LNTSGARFSVLFQIGPEAHPAPYTVCTGSFLGVNRPGRRVDHLPPSSAEDKERVELHIYSTPWAFMACFRSYFTFTFYLTKLCGGGTKIAMGILIKLKFVILAYFLVCPGKTAVMHVILDTSLTGRSSRLFKSFR